LEFTILLVQRFFRHKTVWLIPIVLALLMLAGLVVESEAWIALGPPSYTGS
jgi:hypothetical protein